MLNVEACRVPGCERYAKLGYIACPKHVRQRKQELRQYGRRVVADREMKRATVVCS